MTIVFHAVWLRLDRYSPYLHVLLQVCNSMVSVALLALLQTANPSKLTLQALQTNVILIEGFYVSFAAISTLHAGLWLSGVLMTLTFTVALFSEQDSVTAILVNLSF